MVFNTQTLTKFLVGSVLLVQSLVAFASISVSESPSYDGSFSINISSSVWSPFTQYGGGGTGTLEELFRLPGANDWVETTTYSGIPGYTSSYPISGRVPGEYKYLLLACGQHQPTNGTCFTHETQVIVYPAPSSAPNYRLDLAKFDLYYGDFNDDGIDGDIYFHEKDLFVLIAGDISIPLLLEQEVGFVIYRYTTPVGYSAPYELRLDKEELSQYQKLTLDYDYFKGDINGDGNMDLFIRGAETGLPSVVALQTSVGYPQFLLPNINTSEHFDPSNRNNIIRLIDHNLDGRADLVLLSAEDGYVLDVIYAMGNGKLDQNYYTVSSLEEIFNFTTYPTNATGTLAGKFRVNESGAATYSIPVFTPEGTAGVTPSVGMSYSSQGSNGIMGKGWSLNAFSAISRCRQTYDQDKQALPISWGSTDRFCLDGQRLLKVSGSYYGEPGSTYRTEIDSQVIVKIHGHVNSEPDYFSVIRKDGSITYFGLTSDMGLSTNSKQTFANNKTMTWYQSVTTDNVGNPIRHFYKQASGKDFRLDRIEYAYGATGSAATDERTVIRFDYEKRPDVMQGYVAGQESRQQWRLKRVDVDNKVNTNVNVRSYHIFYNIEMAGNTATKRSLVGAIQECVRTSCKRATKFDWDLVKGQIDSSIDDSIQISTNDRILMDFRHADFNGDGVLDIVWLHRYWDQDFIGGSLDTPLKYAISINGELTNAEFAEGGEMISYPESGDSYEEVRIEPIDYNLDGRSDLAVFRSRGTNANSWEIYLSVPTAINGQVDWRLSKNHLTTVAGNRNSLFTDINGDGLVDVVTGGSSISLLKPRFTNPQETDYKSNNFYHFVPAPSKGWTNMPSTSDPVFWMWGNDPQGFEIISLGSSTPDRCVPAEFNGDGLPDLICSDRRDAIVEYDGSGPQSTETISSTRTFVFIQKSTSFEKILDLDITPLSEIRVVDVNMDGLSDLLVKRATSIKLYKSTGQGLADPVDVATVTHNSTFQLMDYNLDGYSDLVEFQRVSNDATYMPRVHIWNSDAGIFKSGVSGLTLAKGKTSNLFMDVNGDGFTDYVRYQDKKLETFLFTNNYQKFEAISGINTGPGSYTDINYEPINNSQHYTSLDIKATQSGTTEYCVWETIPGGAFSTTPNPVRRFRVCRDYALYSADDFYTALNKGIDYSFSKLKTNTPVLEMNGPFQVVTRVTTQSPSSTLDNDPSSPDSITGASSVDTETVAAVEYYYNEAKIQAGGRGFLGFHQLTTEDIQTGIKTSTIYRQDFPFIGSPLSTFVYAPDETGLLSESHNVFELLNWPSNASATAQASGTAALGIIKPYVRESVEVSYLTASSVESGGAIELLEGSSTNIGGCVDDGAGCHPYLNQDTTQQISHKVLTLNDIDTYGNAIATVVETTGDGLTQRIETSNTYGPGSVTLHGTTFSYAELGRLTSTTVVKSRNGVAEPSQSSTFTYYSSVFPGMLETETVAPGGLQNENLVTTYIYDSLGLLTQKSVEGWDGNNVVTRSAETFYDPSGRFVNYSEDALNHKLDEVLARNEYGAPISIKGLNGVQVTKTYDVWGRETSTATNAGGSVSTSYVFCPYAGIECPDNGKARTAVIQRTSAASNAITAVTFYDAMGREVRAGSLSFDGSMVYVDTEYDVTGRVVRKSHPYFASELNGSHDWVRNYYDVLGRPLMMYAPDHTSDGSISKFEYDGYTHTSINDLGQKKIEAKNGLDELDEVEDELGGKIQYSYTTTGQLKSTKAVEINPTSYVYGTISGLCHQPTSNYEVVLCYDRLGRKTAMWDPDKGHWTYEYNAFGELIKQTNANGHYVETDYDILGRSIKRWDYKQGGALEGYTTWHYDGIDDEGFEVANSTLQTTAVAYSEGREHAYPTSIGPVDPSQLGDYVTRSLFDNVGRAIVSERVLPDGNLYRTEVTFDSEGRVKKEFNILNDVLVRNGNAIESGIENVYDSSGFLIYILNLEDNKKIYEPTGFDEKGNLKTANLGQNKVLITNEYHEHTSMLATYSAVSGGISQNFTYEWDSIGNLRSRTNQNSTLSGSTALIEEFCYDQLNRFVKSYETINTTGGLSGINCPVLESAFDVTYDQFGNIKRKADVGTYKYGEVDSNSHRAGPHALTSIDNAPTKYRYDNNGNLLNDGSRSFEYSTYDMPLSITKGSHEINFKYGPSRARYYREDINSATSTTEKTWYLGNIEKIEKADGSIEWRRMLEGGVIHTYTTNSSNVETVALKKRYMLKDHLGSASLILEEQGANVVVAQSMSFDVWGQRRNAQNMQDLTSAQLINFDTSITTRGYTGHEMLDEVGVIHMNGRIYDPRLGRFLQADPYIDGVKNLQGYNRYSYLHNNPLNTTDPTGFFGLQDFFKVAMVAVISVVTYGAASAWAAGMLAGTSAGCSLALSSFIAGAVGGMAAGFAAGISGAAFSGASGSDILQAGLRGALFGAISGGVYGSIGSSYMSLGGKALAHGFTGGIISDLQGGKFGHGFISGGFTKLININRIMPNDSGTFADVTRVFSAAIVGGTISEATGGKFANGAITAAFAQMMNGNSEIEKNKRDLSSEWDQFRAAVKGTKNPETGEGWSMTEMGNGYQLYKLRQFGVQYGTSAHKGPNVDVSDVIDGTTAIFDAIFHMNDAAEIGALYDSLSAYIDEVASYSCSTVYWQVAATYYNRSSFWGGANFSYSGFEISYGTTISEGWPMLIAPAVTYNNISGNLRTYSGVTILERGEVLVGR